MELNDQTNELYALFKIFLKKIGEEWKSRSGDNLPLSHIRMLTVLQRREKEKVAELADCLHVTPGAITGIADKLIQRGYVERRRDETDRRVVYLQLTEEGQSAVKGLDSIQQQLYADILARLDMQDIEHLKRIFSTMIELVDSTNRKQG
ncbi:MarR family winged helix-turn-helix transcriptional regulator [Paenibacillus sp. GCM10012307]|uniref:MarR family transcriptional regulator n=1 Tax=Paenibacillus roseus TaxID=2798579 RepID=A0A934J8P9_9BACL|nr:MarR family transcriptional regulator [Paenibacillus roseus]MBJ6362736.1 MarR family transcriptional regulator [Paenibacillus roseus]